MRNLLHQLWPLAAVVSLVAVLALQIPRKALLFTPVPERVPKPFASFVQYDARTYAALVQRARMSWQVRAPGDDPAADGREDDLGADAGEPPPAELPLPAEFSLRRAADVTASAASAALRPETAAIPPPATPVPVPPDDGAEADDLRRDLRELPDSLKTTEKEPMP